MSNKGHRPSDRKKALTACRLRLVTQKSWQDIADAVGVNPCTIIEWRKHESWPEIVAEATRTADTQGLLAAARLALLDILEDNEANAHTRLAAVKFVLSRADDEFADHTSPIADNRSISFNIDSMSTDELRELVNADEDTSSEDRSSEARVITQEAD